MCYVWLVLTVYFGLQDNLLAIFLLNLTFVVFFKPWQFFLLYLGHAYQVISLFVGAAGDEDAKRKQSEIFETYLIAAYAWKDIDGCVRIEIKEA